MRKKTLINETIHTQAGDIQVEGYCDVAFTQVLEQLELNFSLRNEVGSGVRVTQNDKTVVDLWGGVADAVTGLASR